MKTTKIFKKIGTYFFVSFTAFVFSFSYLFAAIERVSVDSLGNESSGSVSYIFPSVSSDGRYVLFISEASNLVVGDTNDFYDVFVHDRDTGTTERVSVDSLGNEGDFGSSDAASISSNGRYVVFLSSSTNLVAGDTNGALDVFVHDRDTGTTERVSVDSLGNEADLGVDISFPKISTDGRYVFFESNSTNLVAGDTNGVSDVFVHDRDTGTTERVSVDSLGNQSNGGSFALSISPDGRYVAFNSNATNLVVGDTNGLSDVFVHDRDTGTTERVSVDSLGNEADNYSVQSNISSDGRYVTFGSHATNLVVGDVGGFLDVFVHDRDTGTTERVSVDSLGNEGDTDVIDEDLPPQISADGRYVAFASAATNLVSDDTNGVIDVFVYDRDTGVIRRISVDNSGDEIADESRRFAFSENGDYLVFSSFSSSLVPGDTNGLIDTFIKNITYNDFPTDISLSPSSINENESANTLVGNLTTTDSDVGDSHTYSFSCSVAGSGDPYFSITGDGIYALNPFDFEFQTSYDICVRTDDGNGGTYDKNFTISIVDVNEGSNPGGSGSNPNPVRGCTDSDASNYNPSATQDNGSCLYEPGAINGCTDETAGNYDERATVDDGSCLYGVFGCMDLSATNYDPSAEYSNNSCVYAPIDPPSGPNDTLGCTNPSANNYNPSATQDNGSCEYDFNPTYGCTDASAQNFNPSANQDDGSCSYDQTDPPVNPGDPTSPNNGGSGGNGGLNPLVNSVSGFVKDNPEILIPVSVVGVVSPYIPSILGNIAGIISIPIRIWNIIPTLLGFRRRKRPWGTVFDSVTKQPLDPVYVMLKDSFGKEISTSITDLDGRYGFQVPAGQYSIFANKANYTFPSVKLVGKTEDELYHDLYFGETLSVGRDGEVIQKNIPMDAQNFNWNEFEKSKNKKLMKFYSSTELFLARISKILFFAGLVASVLLTIIDPRTFNLIILGLYIVILVLAFFGIKPRASGFVREKGTGFPLSFGIISVFSAELGREVAHTIIGKTGKYYLLVPKGSYFLKIRKKTGEDSYEDLYQSESFVVKKGYINRVIKV